MTIVINELAVKQISGINKRLILDAHRRDPQCRQKHQLVGLNDLASCLAGIFYQSYSGYLHLPLEKMAGLLLHRFAQGQFFLDGNKRTALVASAIFLKNHNLTPRLDRFKVNDLVWGFANAGVGSQYGENDAIRYIFENVLPGE